MQGETDETQNIAAIMPGSRPHNQPPRHRCVAAPKTSSPCGLAMMTDFPNPLFELIRF